MQENIKKRLVMLESQQPQPKGKSLEDRIAEYVHIMDVGDYDSEQGKELKATIEKYAPAIQKIEEE